MKTVVTITGIRPDFIRMSEVFRRFDENTNFSHILIHTGQHYDRMLSDIFFDELNIRKPDYNLEIGGTGKEHYHQLGELSVKIIELLKTKKINPDIILFLGDSNSVGCAFPLKKEGYKIGHIEAGMRSYDRRMLEEINRTVCDHCSDELFVYHSDYENNLRNEGIAGPRVKVVGNTIVEVAQKYANFSLEGHKDFEKSLRNYILMDIHRPENFKYVERMQQIFLFAKMCSDKYNIPVKMLSFARTLKYLYEYNMDPKNYGIELVGLMSYKSFLRAQYDAKFMISDSGTAQEEPALFNTPVIVPREYTERPQSIKNNCSYLLKNLDRTSMIYASQWPNAKDDCNPMWLGDANTSYLIRDALL